MQLGLSQLSTTFQHIFHNDHSWNHRPPFLYNPISHSTYQEDLSTSTRLAFWSGQVIEPFYRWATVLCSACHPPPRPPRVSEDTGCVPASCQCPFTTPDKDGQVKVDEANEERCDGLEKAEVQQGVTGYRGSGE